MLTPVFNPPKQRNLFNSASSAGSYDLASALADIIDNSISAGATTISIYMHFDYDNLEDSWITITDNGCGMTFDELRKNMQLASEDPEKEREPTDLGRFGFGMKSASLSQGRSLTVVTKTIESQLSVALWDKDSEESEWMMPMGQGKDAEQMLRLPIESESGTQIIWGKLTHLTDGYSLTYKLLDDIQSSAIDELRLTYHRLIESGMKLIINNEEQLARNPFAGATSEPSTKFPYKDSEIICQAFNLPHFGNLTSSQENDLGGSEGLLRNQGFYVYRNKRLIIHGTWFGIIKHSAAYQLSRFQLDVPNSLDKYWKISIDKKNAQLPMSLKKNLLGYIKTNNKTSTAVLQNRPTKRKKATENGALWHMATANGVTRFQANRSHPLIKSLMDQSDEEVGKDFATALLLLEASLPIEVIRETIEKKNTTIVQPQIESDQYSSIVKSSFEFLIKNGLGYSQLLEVIETTEPFSRSKVRAKQILESIYPSE